MGMHCSASISILRCSDAAYVHQKRKIILHEELCCDCKTAFFAGFYQQDIKLIKVHSVEPPGESLIAFRVQRSAGMSTNDLLRKIGQLCPRILQNLFVFSLFMTVGTMSHKNEKQFFNIILWTMATGQKMSKKGSGDCF